MDGATLKEYGDYVIGGIKMNWLILVVLAILVFYAVNGRRKGLIKTVFIMFSTIISLVATGIVAPTVSKAVQKNERVVSVVSEKIESIMDYSEIGSKKTEEVEFIDKLTLPSAMKNALLENNTADIYKAMAVDSFKEYVSNYLTRTFINAMVFIVVFIIVKVILIVISKTLDIISKLPVLNGLNKSVGMVAGLLHGLIIVWVGCIVVNLFITSTFGQYMYAEITRSQLLSFIYNNNLLLRFITNVGKILF